MNFDEEDALGTPRSDQPVESETAGLEAHSSLQKAAQMVQFVPAKQRLSRRRFTVLVAGVIALFVFGFSLGHWVFPPRLGPTDRLAPRTPGVIQTLQSNTVFRVNTQQRLVALTFDDGPSVKWTGQILDLLKKHQVKATFFVIGSEAKEHPELIKREVEAGMEIGVHEWEHKDVTTLNLAQIEQRIDRTVEAITAAGAPEPRYYRPPYGRLDSPALYQSARHGFTNILWTDHIPGRDARANVERILTNLTPGSIILCHDGRTDPTMQLLKSLDRFIIELKTQGYQFVTISELLKAPRA